MVGRVRERLDRRAVLYGWIVAVLTGLALNFVFELAHVFLFGGDLLTSNNPTAALVTLSLLSGFLAHFAGGYVAGRRARHHGGLQGAMVAVLGFLFVVVAAAAVLAVLAATAGVFLIEGTIPLPTLTPGFAGGALLASLALLLLNVLGGFFGGVMGQWEHGPVEPPSTRPRPG